MLLHDYDIDYFMNLDIDIGIPLLQKMREKTEERKAFQMWVHERLYMDEYQPFSEYWKPIYIKNDYSVPSDDVYKMAEEIERKIAQKGD